MKEIWEPVPYKEFEDYFEVSNLGRVKRLRREVVTNKYSYFLEEKIVTQRTNNIEPLLFCDLKVNGFRKSAYVHKMVAMCFILNVNNYTLVSHLSEDKTDNTMNNLYWNTQSEVSKQVFVDNPENRNILKDLNIKSGYYSRLRLEFSTSKTLEIYKDKFILGKTYREIAKANNCSISKIHRLCTR